MPEERLSISSSARVHPDEVARHTFGTTRRGFDPAEVRSFLEHVARELMASADREQELRRALTEAESLAANPVLDESTLTAALGTETARVLRSAHEAAADLVGRAREEAEQLQRHTEQSAHDRAAEADAAVAELRRRAHEEATARVEGAKLEAEALVTQTRADCRSMVQEAQELRARVLADLTRRRRVLHSQIEQLRAGRERLAETIGDVRHAVDEITDELFRAEDEARLAAEAAGRQAAQEELAEISTTEIAGGDLGAPLSTGGRDEEIDTRQSVEELFARLRAEAGAVTVADESAATAAPAAPVVTAMPASDRPVRPVPGSDEPTPDGSALPAPVLDELSPEESATGEIIESVRILPGGPEAPVPKTPPAKEGSGQGPGAASRPRTTTARGKVGAQRETPPPGPASAALGGSDAADAVDTEAGDDEAEAVDPVVAQRDEVLTPLMAALARRLKRVLQDDQNDILDRLRAKGGWAPGVLPSEDDHAGRYVLAASDQLMEASRAGATFAGGKADDAPGVEDVAASLASEIVAPLRRRLEGAGPSVEEGDESALVELVGAAYREWKGARTERLAGDRTLFSFARGALAAVPKGTELRWVVNDDVAECPDCDDNALAGPVPSRDAFPTGHQHPPAHAGCRCLLVPANA
jgi:DivIVA domain-containing protein